MSLDRREGSDLVGKSNKFGVARTTARAPVPRRHIRRQGEEIAFNSVYLNGANREVRELNYVFNHHL